MQHEHHPDTPPPDAEPQILAQLDAVLRKIQERVAEKREPEHTFALLHMVEGLSIEEWRELAARMDLHGWLALPLDKEDGVPLDHLRGLLEELTFQRDHDFLTGLVNRRRFERLADLELQRAHRTGNLLSVVMLDIDDFKLVNDTYGHATGDKVLAALGDLLRRSMRVYDVAARLGGEEFCLLLPGATRLQAYDLTVRLLEAFTAIAFETAEGATFSKTFSAGIATSGTPPAGETVESLLRQADELLYLAKRLGKNKVCTHTVEHPAETNPVLVRAAEKQFLYTGKLSQ